MDGLSIELGVTPGLVGTNEIEMRLAERDGTPVEGARVAVTLVGPGLAAEQVTAHDLREGLYHVPGPPLTVAGPWSFAVEVQRANAFDARATFSVDIGLTRPVAQPPSAARVSAAAVLGGLIVAAALGLTLRARRRRLAPAGDV